MADKENEPRECEKNFDDLGNEKQQTKECNKPRRSVLKSFDPLLPPSPAEKKRPELADATNKNDLNTNDSTFTLIDFSCDKSVNEEIYYEIQEPEAKCCENEDLSETTEAVSFEQTCIDPEKTAEVDLVETLTKLDLGLDSIKDTNLNTPKHYPIDKTEEGSSETIGSDCTENVNAEVSKVDITKKPCEDSLRERDSESCEGIEVKIPRQNSVDKSENLPIEKNEVEQVELPEVISENSDSSGLQEDLPKITTQLTVKSEKDTNEPLVEIQKSSSQEDLSKIATQSIVHHSEEGVDEPLVKSEKSIVDPERALNKCKALNKNSSINEGDINSDLKLENVEVNLKHDSVELDQDLNEEKLSSGEQSDTVKSVEISSNNSDVCISEDNTVLEEDLSSGTKPLVESSDVPISEVLEKDLNSGAEPLLHISKATSEEEDLQNKIVSSKIATVPIISVEQPSCSGIKTIGKSSGIESIDKCEPDFGKSDIDDSCEQDRIIKEYISEQVDFLPQQEDINTTLDDETFEEPKSVDGNDTESSENQESVKVDPTITEKVFLERKSTMSELSTEKLQQEISDLKLQLNASQQGRASLELLVRQKEEIVIKTQLETLKREQTLNQEIKELKEKLKEKSNEGNKTRLQELEEGLEQAKAREAQAVADLNEKIKDDMNYQKIMDEYENTLAARISEYGKLKEEHETVRRHLANLELAFSDVHQKYERSKDIIDRFKTNEDTLSQNLQIAEDKIRQHEEKYESLKAYAKAQIEKCNVEIIQLRDKYEAEISKLRALNKRLEIKCSSLETSLRQKTDECSALSALCDEVTGKKL